MRRIDIGIIGCGVGGCAAAILLHRLGHRVTLFEQSPRVGPVGAGVLLQTSGQRILQSMGLLDAVIARAERIDELIAHTHRGGLLSRLRFADRPGGHTAYGVHRGDLFGVLHAALLCEGIELRLNHRISRVAERTLFDGDGRDIGDFDLIVVADGGRSRIRQTSGATAFAYAYRSAALWTVGCDAGVRNRLVQTARYTHQLCGLLPTGGGRCSFFWGLQADEWPRVGAGRFDVWRQQVIDLMPVAAPLLNNLHGFEDLTFTKYQAVWMPRAVRGRCVFIGDAAHASSPLLGHGINLAMRDAADIAAAVAGAGSVGGVLDAYNVAQRWRNAYYSGLSAVLNPSFQSRSTLLGAARDVVLPRLQRIAPARSLMLRTLCGVLD